MRRSHWRRYQARETHQCNTLLEDCVKRRRYGETRRPAKRFFGLVGGEPLRGLEITRQAARGQYEHQNPDGRDQAYYEHRIA